MQSGAYGKLRRFASRHRVTIGFGQRTDDKGRAVSFMARLARASGGNTLAMLAAFLIPMSALTGSAVDIGRLYLVKVRLQQACDAGALAGRKFMADSNSATLDATATTQARTFFANNFPSGIMGTPAYTAATVPFTPTKTTDKQVAGTATTQVPMTVMKMFGQPTRSITVTCEARYDIADTDVMFVLDTTGSMVCAPSETGGCTMTSVSYTRPDGTTGYSYVEKPSSKIVALRSAVMDFYDTVAANADPSSHVRYGVVTYTSTVNAGAAVPSQYLLSTDWNYQTRRAIGDQNFGNVTTTTYNNVTSATCNGYTGRTPALFTDKYGNTAYTYASDGTANWKSVGSWNANWYNPSLGTCTIRNQPVVALWRYAQWPADVSGYISSLSGGAAVQDPGKSVTSLNRWQGCLEERQTTASTSFDVTNLPPDLDPDLIPNSDATKWKPMWPEQIYDRSGTSTYDISDQYVQPNPPNNSYYSYFVNVGGDASNLASGFVSCGKPVQRLTTMTRSQLSNYVNASDFKAIGGTYHDTGMIWGTRMLSPNGIFAADTAAWPGRQSPNRAIVFMTDGDMAPNYMIYGMYGIERYDQRVSAGDFSSLTDRHNARFLAECAAAKARNITVYVIGFGQTLTPQLTQCASPGQAFYASDSASLSAAFKKIANQVAMLRVSK